MDVDDVKHRQLWLSMDIDDKAIQDQIYYYQVLAKNYITDDNVKWEQPTSFHITIDFISDDESNYQPIIDAMHDYEKLNIPMNTYVFAQGYHTFDQGVLWLGVNYYWDMLLARESLKVLIENHGYHYNRQFDDYVPHITLAYGVKEVPAINIPNKIAIPFNNITLWNSFKVNDQYVDNILYQIK